MHRAEDAPTPALEAHVLAAPALIGDAASRADIEAALNALGAKLNEVIEVLLAGEHLR